MEIDASSKKPDWLATSKSMQRLRKKILKGLPRASLEAMLDPNRSPWNWAREDLETFLLTEWDDYYEDIAEAVQSLLREAR
jgi:hypothetical protein